MEAKADSETIAIGSSTDSGTMCPKAVRHPHLYLEHEEGTVIILVEETLFKIHGYFLKHYSVTFGAILSLHPGDAPVEGRSDELPVQLPQVEATDFERFLYLFYPTSVPLGDLTTLEDWKSVLRIAHRYMFMEHRGLAIERLKTLCTPVDRIILSREYDIEGWLEGAYYELCMRDEALNLEEGTRLGMADVIAISGLRQLVRGGIAMEARTIVWYIQQKLRQSVSP
ncbi:hypothetical protein PYCCODRAFT_1436867 [Trametes coccinea BRFM310]|uniref:BTB domain-containing protein n=1 Tax=Trametes coccinea (strain BRFM310) TaxID=1353009 RepID=A0A1Y2II06_TRAC3|nr:hypothetical protein PYCCODRAFT_1436867 [Trametes coccinea BRFM310]